MSSSIIRSLSLPLVTVAVMLAAAAIAPRSAAAQGPTVSGFVSPFEHCNGVYRANGEARGHTAWLTNPAFGCAMDFSMGVWVICSTPVGLTSLHCAADVVNGGLLLSLDDQVFFC